MDTYLKTKNFILNKKDIISLDEFGDKIRICYWDWLKSDKNEVDCYPVTKYKATMFAYKKDVQTTITINGGL